MAWHESLLRHGRDKQDYEDCTCQEAECGYVLSSVTCPHHAYGAGGTIRRAHPADQCGGAHHHTEVER